LFIKNLLNIVYWYVDSIPIPLKIAYSDVSDSETVIELLN